MTHGLNAKYKNYEYWSRRGVHKIIKAWFVASDKPGVNKISKRITNKRERKEINKLLKNDIELI